MSGPPQADFEQVQNAGEPEDDWSAPCELGQAAGAGRIEGASPSTLATSIPGAYPLRLEHALFSLEHTFSRHDCPAALAFAMPLLRRMAQEPDGSCRGVTRAVELARCLAARAEATEAESPSRELIVRSIQQCLERGNHLVASSLLGRLSAQLLESDPRAALAATEQMARYAERAGAQPVSHGGPGHLRLQALSALGRYDDVLDEVAALFGPLEPLPPEGNEPQLELKEAREAILEAGHRAAMLSEAWQTALHLNARIVRAEEAGGADNVQLARRRLEDYRPLARLKRYDEARAVLERCRAAFAEAEDVGMPAMACSARADLEDLAGDPSLAVRFQGEALGYAYAAGLPDACAVSHLSLAAYLRRFGSDDAAALTHELAAALIWHEAGSSAIDSSVRMLAEAEPPFQWPKFAGVVSVVEALPGVQFAAMFEQLPRRVPDGDAAIAAVRAMVIDMRLGERRAKARRSWLRRKGS